MKIILLPGASDSNKMWADSWEKALAGVGHEIFKIYYDHWGTRQMFNFKSESAKFLKLHDSWKNGVVVAKSIGTLLTFYSVHNRLIRPIKAIFMGVPSKMNGERIENTPVTLDEWISDYNIPTTVIQNEHDPVTSFADAESFLRNLPSIKFIKTPGDTHKYLPETLFTEVLREIP